MHTSLVFVADTTPLLTSATAAAAAAGTAETQHAFSSSSANDSGASARRSTSGMSTSSSVEDGRGGGAEEEGLPVLQRQESKDDIGVRTGTPLLGSLGPTWQRYTAQHEELSSSEAPILL